MDERSDSCRGEMRGEFVSRPQPHREEMVHVTGVALANRRHRVWQLTPILRSQLTAARGPRGKKRQLRAEDSCLQFVQPAVHARLGMMIAVSLAAVSQSAHSGRDRLVARDHSAAIAKCTKVL